MLEKKNVTNWWCFVKYKIYAFFYFVWWMYDHLTTRTETVENCPIVSCQLSALRCRYICNSIQFNLCVFLFLHIVQRVSVDIRDDAENGYNHRYVHCTLIPPCTLTRKVKVTVCSRCKSHIFTIQRNMTFRLGVHERMRLPWPARPTYLWSMYLYVIFINFSVISDVYSLVLQ